MPPFLKHYVLILSCGVPPWRAAPQAEIVGAPDIHVDMGSTVNLSCIISHSPEPPAYIFWYHNGKVTITAKAPASVGLYYC